VRPVIFIEDIPGNQMYDFYSTTNYVGFNETMAPYTTGPIQVGVEVSGAWGDLTCATSDASDENFNTGCLETKKSLWYKFTSGEQSIIRIRIESSTGANPNVSTQLFQQTNPADSVLNTGFDPIPFLSIVNQGGFSWFSYCLPAGEYYIHVSTCFTANTSVIRPVVISEYSPGDGCEQAVATSAPGAGVYNAQTVLYCNTIGRSFGEDGSNLGCLPGPQGYYSSWFRFEYTGSDVVDVLFQLNLSNFNNYGSTSDVRYRLFYGNSCSSMIEGQECATNVFINNSISCITSAVGVFYIQVVYPNTATGTLGYRYTVSINNNVNCNPFDPFFINSDFIYRPNCAGDSIYFTNFSTFGANLEYYWDFGFPGGSSTELDPIVSFPAGAGSYDVSLLVINPANADSVVSSQTITISSTGNPLSLGPDFTRCIGDTVAIGQSIPTATYNWSTGDSTAQIFVSDSGSYSVTVDIGGCLFSDTLMVDFIPLQVSIGNDTLFCQNQTIQLQPQLPSIAEFLWSDSITILQRIIDAPGTYILNSTLGSCIASDTIDITEIEFQFSLGNDTTACLANGLLLAPDLPPFQNFLWSDSSTGDTLLVFQPGIVSLQIDSLGCVFSDSIRIDPIDLSFTLGNDTTICLGASLMLNPVVYSLAGFLWSTADTSASITVRDSGQYALRIDFEGCFYSDTLLLNTYDKPETSILYPPDNPCVEDCFKLDAELIRAEYWFWITDSGVAGINENSITYCFPAFGNYPVTLAAINRCGNDSSTMNFIVQLDTTLTISPDTTVFSGDTARVWASGGSNFNWTSPVTIECDTCQSGFGIFIEKAPVYVTLNDQYNCPVLDTVNVSVYKEFGIYIPNTFTPNNDGKNDVFEVYHYGVNAISLEIYNRFGELIFTTNSLVTVWDGSYKGKTVQNEVYTYVVRYSAFDGRADKLNGKVLVLK
jgi:gliding motility-associated-like protein